MNWQKQWRILFICLFSLATISLSFQNCSDVSFAPADPNSALDCGENCDQKGTAEVTAGAQALPPLKLFFIVDNSYTMLANQLNLSQAFTRMFDNSNSSNLTPFASTAFIINTSQRNYAWGSAQLTQLNNSLKNLPDLSVLSLSSIISTHRTGSTISGEIPGDVIGYDLDLDVALNRWNFSPAPILGIVTLANGQVNFLKGIEKTKGAAATSIQEEFQKRLALLNPEKNPYEFPEVLDNESGLCAMARIMRNNSDYVQPGELSAFVIITDENEADEAGKNCIQSYTRTKGNEDLINGYCELRSTRFEYTQKVDATCRADYKTGYKIQYVYQQPNPKTKITYRKLDSETYTTPVTAITHKKNGTTTYTTPKTTITYKKLGAYTMTMPRTTITYHKVNTQTYTTPATDITYYKAGTTTYSAPRTQISYYKIVSQTMKRTTVNYYLRNCPVRDGVEVTHLCTYNAQSAVVLGNVTDTCNQAATNLNSAAVTNNPSYMPSCIPATPIAQACAYTNSDCDTTWSSHTADVYGTYANGSACDDRTLAISGAVINTTHPASCSALPNETGPSACPANSPGCVATLNYVQQTQKNILGQYLDGTTACQDRAKLISGAVVDATRVATCAVANPASVTASGTCPANTPGCSTNTTYTTATVTVDGTFAPASTACQDRAKLISGAVVDATRVATCIAATTDSRAGQCPVSGAPGCLTITNYDTLSTTVNGNFFSSSTVCQDRAKLISGAIVDSNNVATCIDAGTGTGTGGCPSNTPGCTATTPVITATTNVNGNFYSSSTVCQDRAKLISGAIVDANNSATCVAASPATASGSGACNVGWPGCTSVKNYSNPTVDVDGTYATAADCLTKAKTLPGNALDPENAPTCAPFTSYTPQTKTASVAFDASIDNGSVAAVGTSCSTVVLNKALASNPSWLAGGSCVITNYDIGSEAITDLTLSCAEKVAQVCNNSMQLKRTCTAVSTPTSYQPMPQLVRNEELDCDDLCSKSVTGMCALVSGVVPSGTTTIRDYLTMAYGSNSCASTVLTPSKVPNSDFTGKYATEFNSICSPYGYSGGTRPSYPVQVGDIYRADITITDYVSGAANSAGNAPEKNLPTYLLQRSNELFSSGLMPIVTSFVRRPANNTVAPTYAADPIGAGGSLGVIYKDFTTLMGGQLESVMADDYSPALVRISALVRDRLERSFTINQMKSYQSVRKAWFKKKNDTDWQEMNLTDWTVSGKTVTLTPTFSFDLGDKFRFEYY